MFVQSSFGRIRNMVQSNHNSNDAVQRLSAYRSYRASTSSRQWMSPGQVEALPLFRWITASVASPSGYSFQCEQSTAAGWTAGCDWPGYAPALGTRLSPAIIFPTTPLPVAPPPIRPSACILLAPSRVHVEPRPPDFEESSEFPRTLAGKHGVCQRRNVSSPPRTFAFICRRLTMPKLS